MLSDLIQKLKSSLGSLCANEKTEFWCGGESDDGRCCQHAPPWRYQDRFNASHQLRCHALDKRLEGQCRDIKESKDSPLTHHLHTLTSSITLTERIKYLCFFGCSHHTLLFLFITFTGEHAPVSSPAVFRKSFEIPPTAKSSLFCLHISLHPSAVMFV